MILHNLWSPIKRHTGGTLMLEDNFLQELQKYIEIHLIKHKHTICESENLILQAPMIQSYIYEEKKDSELQDYINSKRKPSFKDLLLDYINKSGLSNSEIYNKAGIDRRHFSKIINNPGYPTSKNTAIAFAIALELNKRETDNLLHAAGHSLTENTTFDLIVQFFIENKKFDLDDINQTLFSFSLKPLSGVIE